jgi:hypothetical protein
MTIEEFDGFGATVMTLTQFSQATANLTAKMREMMLIVPD